MCQTIATFLAKHELSSYTAAFDKHGWDSLPALQDISDDDLKQLVTDVAMKSGHAARLRTALGKAPAAAATAPAEKGVSRTRHIFWKPGTVSGRTAHWRKPGQSKWPPAPCGPPVNDVSSQAAGMAPCCDMTAQSRGTDS